jgi:hypothetical protein
MFSLFKSKLTVDQAAEALYAIMGKENMTKWLSQLSQVPELDLVRAGDELLFLDVFATYCSLKFTRSPGWSEKRLLVFESFLGLFLTWLGKFWESRSAGTMDDAGKAIDSRFKAYGASIEATPPAPDETRRLIGMTFAAYAFADGRFSGRPKEKEFPEFLRKLSQDQSETVIRVAEEVFNHRIQTLEHFFESHKLK